MDYRAQAEKLVARCWSDGFLTECDEVGLIEHITEALRAAREALREAVTLADSYLSLVYHRHLAKETVDTSLDLELQHALGVIRKAANAFHAERRRSDRP